MNFEEKSIVNNEEYIIRVYRQVDLVNLLDFFQTCLPESGRMFEADGAHASLLDVEKSVKEKHFHTEVCVLRMNASTHSQNLEGKL